MPTLNKTPPGRPLTTAPTGRRVDKFEEAAHSMSELDELRRRVDAPGGIR